MAKSAGTERTPLRSGFALRMRTGSEKHGERDRSLGSLQGASRMKSAIFGTLFVMAGMTAALVFINDSSRHMAVRVYVPGEATLQSAQ